MNSYRQVNPACTLPALVLDDGTVLTEVIGMFSYLEELSSRATAYGQHTIRTSPSYQLVPQTVSKPNGGHRQRTAQQGQTFSQSGATGDVRYPPNT